MSGEMSLGYSRVFVKRNVYLVNKNPYDDVEVEKFKQELNHSDLWSSLN